MAAPDTEGGNLIIEIDEDEYRKGVEATKHSVIGRLIVRSGDGNWNMELRRKLGKIWGLENSE